MIRKQVDQVLLIHMSRDLSDYAYMQQLIYFEFSVIFHFNII